MRGRPANLAVHKTTLSAAVDAAKRLVVAASALSGLNPRTLKSLHPKQVRRIVELAFMGMLSAWDDFLEATFVRYLAGATAPNGFRPVLRLGPANSLIHAYQVLTADPHFDLAKKYTKFSDAGWVASQATLFFEAGHPFVGLTSRQQLLSHAVAIRNRVAHSSEKSKTDFKKTALAFLVPLSGKLTQGFRAGDLLMAPATRHFPSDILSRHPSVFDAYAALFDAEANRLVP
jgi:hypothetical protein